MSDPITLRLLDRRVRRIVKQVQNDLQHSYQWEEFAAEAQLTRRQLERLFQRELQSSPHQYLLTQRLEKGRELLVTTNALVKEIAAQVGMKDVNHFIREFKKMYGLTPNAYRNQSPLEEIRPDVAIE